VTKEISTVSLIARQLAEKCASFGLPPSFDTLMRHMENNHAATVGAQRSHIESLERQLVGAVEERERLRAALEFYAEEDSEFDAGGVDGGRRALEALGLPLGGQ
jgi:hypothetical protein